MRRVMIKPSWLLQEVDGLAANDRVRRSEFIRRAMNRYLQQRRRLDLQERLKRGYQEMGGLNLALAEEGLALDQESLALIGKKGSP